MPREGAKGKWNMEISPEMFYQKEDPFKVLNDPEEHAKADFVNGLIENPESSFYSIDIGCGEGHFTICSVGIDISPFAIGRARRLYSQQTQFYVWDITKEPLHQTKIVAKSCRKYL